MPTNQAQKGRNIRQGEELTTPIVKAHHTRTKNFTGPVANIFLYIGRGQNRLHNAHYIYLLQAWNLCGGNFGIEDIWHFKCYLYSSSSKQAWHTARFGARTKSTYDTLSATISVDQHRIAITPQTERQKNFLERTSNSPFFFPDRERNSKLAKYVLKVANIFLHIWYLQIVCLRQRSNHQSRGKLVTWEQNMYIPCTLTFITARRNHHGHSRRRQASWAELSRCSLRSSLQKSSKSFRVCASMQAFTGKRRFLKTAPGKAFVLLMYKNTDKVIFPS